MGIRNTIRRILRERVEEAVYFVKLQSSSSADTLYQGTDENIARDIFDNYDMDDVSKEMRDRSDLFVEIIRETGDDWEVIAVKELKRVNAKSDELLSQVEDYYRKKFGGFKYFEIDVEDDNEELVGTISLRISDHTENIYNIDKYGHKYHISVVIADYDPTEERFGSANKMERRGKEIEIKFNSDNTAEDIIKEVNALIKKFAKKIIAENL